VQAGRFGACLMREPALVAECIAAMIDAAGAVPVTLKCRLGVDELEDYDVFAAFVDTVAATGCDTFVVHARKAWLQGLSPKENREIPPLRYDWVDRLKAERPGLRVILNGGLADVDAAVAAARRLDGAMIGRAAYHEPYRLHLMDRALFAPDAPPRTRAALLRDLRPYAESMLARGVAIKHLTRHVLGLFHGQPGGRAFRQVLSEGAPKPGADWSLVERALALTEREAA
jgi:tRNA-dihydrouridine synthase A